MAKALHARSEHKIALIEQDYYKEVMFNDKPSSAAVRHEMIIADALLALRHGFDVIMDGIFSLNSHKPTFEKLFAEHPEENYLFYFDVSFDETLRRHQTRAQKELFGETEMREWFKLNDHTGHSFEQVIPETSTLEETIDTIRQAAGL